MVGIGLSGETEGNLEDRIHAQYPGAGGFSAK